MHLTWGRAFFDVTGNNFRIVALGVIGQITDGRKKSCLKTATNDMLFSCQDNILAVDF